MRGALVALVVAACHKAEPGPPCEQVVDHLLDVTRAQQDLKQLSQRKTMVEHCERKLTADERTCLLAAKDSGAIAACQGRSPPPPAPGAPGPASTR
jgi:hypothetical protein